jgi:hypothetical protein
MCTDVRLNKFKAIFSDHFISETDRLYVKWGDTSVTLECTGGHTTAF